MYEIIQVANFLTISAETWNLLPVSRFYTRKAHVGFVKRISTDTVAYITSAKADMQRDTHDMSMGSIDEERNRSYSTEKSIR